MQLTLYNTLDQYDMDSNKLSELIKSRNEQRVEKWQQIFWLDLPIMTVLFSH